MNLIKPLSKPLLAALFLGALNLTFGRQVHADPASSPSKTASQTKKKTPAEAGRHAAQAQLNRISAKVKRVLSDEMGVESQFISARSSLVGDLGVEPEALPELMIILGEEFDIEISTKDSKSLVTVGQVISYIARRKGVAGVLAVLGAAATKPSTPFAGAHLYLQASESLVNREQLRKVVLNDSSPVTLAQQRLLSSNDAALKMVRQGLLVPYREPQGPDFFSPSPVERFEAFGDLSQLLVLDGKAKAARGNRAGAVSSYLDSIQLGMDLMRGGAVVSMHAGFGCQGLGRQLLWASKDHLDAKVAQEAARRLQALEDKRVTFAEILEGEKRLDMADLQESLATATAQKEREGIREARRAIADFTKFTDAVMAKARQPYAARGVMPQLQSGIGQVKMLAATYKESTWAVAVGDQAQNALLTTVIALRAYEQEHGGLPESLVQMVGTSIDKIPLDPFASSGPVRYRRESKRKGGYLLYSVGPDGKDNQGKPVDQPGYGRGRYTVLWNSIGDVVAGTNTKANYFVVVG